MDVQARLGPALALPRQSERLDPRADLQGHGGRGGVQQSAAHQHAWQSGGSQSSADPAVGRGDRRARAVPFRVLAGAFVCAGREAGRGAGVRRHRAAQNDAAAQADRRATAEARGWSAASGTRSCRHCWQTRLRWMRNSRACEPRSPRRGRSRPRNSTRTTTPRPRRAMPSSTCCSRRLAGSSINRATGSSRSTACPTTRARASSTMCCGR